MATTTAKAKPARTASVAKPKVASGIPAVLDRTKDVKAVAASKAALAAQVKADANPKLVMPRTASDVPQPKLAHGNNGVHSREAVRQNAAKAAALVTNNGKLGAARKSPPKPGTTKPAATPAKPKGGAAKAAKPVAADRKITAKAKAATVREGTWTHFMVTTALTSKTTAEADATVAKSREYSHKKMDWSWLVAKGHVTLA